MSLELELYIEPAFSVMMSVMAILLVYEFIYLIVGEKKSAATIKAEGEEEAKYVTEKNAANLAVKNAKENAKTQQKDFEKNRKARFEQEFANELQRRQEQFQKLVIEKGLTYAEEFKKGWIRYVQYVRNTPPIEIIRNIKPLRQELVKGLLKYVDMFSQQYKAAVEEFHQEYSVSHDNVRFGYSEDLNAEGNIIRQSVKDGFVGVPNIDTRINEAFLSSNHRAEWEHSHANLVAEHSLLDAKLREGMPNNQVALQTLNFAARELQEADKALALFEHFPTFTPDHPPSIAPDKLSAITRLKQRVISNQAEQTGQQMETYILSLEKYIEDVEKLRVDVSKAATAYQRACEEFENDIIAQLQR